MCSGTLKRGGPKDRRLRGTRAPIGDNKRSFELKIAWKRLSVASVAALLSACGTTYPIPEPSAADRRVAAETMAEEKAMRDVRGGVSRAAFRTVTARVEPVAESFCRAHVEDDVPCDIEIRLISEPEPNAFQFYEGESPIVAFTTGMLAEARNDHEIAFVLGHEMGHHIASHIEKQQQQAMAGALIGGVLAGAAAMNDPHMTQVQAEDLMENTMTAGAAIGNRAYSQTFELEADMIGTHISTRAGYDAQTGARLFARARAATTPSGTRSFWGTHPPSEARIATVAATVREARGAE